jgi:hypothetical protein
VGQPHANDDLSERAALGYLTGSAHQILLTSFSPCQTPFHPQLIGQNVGLVSSFPSFLVCPSAWPRVPDVSFRIFCAPGGPDVKVSFGRALLAKELPSCVEVRYILQPQTVVPGRTLCGV